MKLETKRKIWAVILTLGLIIFFATGCKPKQISKESYEVKTDSSAIYSLQEQISAKSLRIEYLQRELNKLREENNKLQEFIYKYEVYYDTNLPVLAETGKPPVKSEITTESKKYLENTIKELEITNLEYRKEAEDLSVKNSNLDLMVKSLKEENRELKEKITPTTGFNIRLFFSGIGIGVLLCIAVWLFFKLR